MDYDAPPVAIAAPAEDAGSRVELPVFVPKTPRCPKHEAGEIVVCAEDPETFRLRPLPDRFGKDDTLPRARTQLNERTSIGAELESQGMPDGNISNRVMLRGRIKF